MDHILKDSRFSHIPVDPRFKRIPKWERKVKIDKRFRRMFSDSKFKVKYTTDKRGRPANTTSAEDLKRYYAISSDEEEEEGSGSDSGKLEDAVEGPSSAPPSAAKSKKASKQKSEKAGSFSKTPNKRLSAVSAGGGSWVDEETGKSDGKESSSEEEDLPGGKGGSSSDDEGIDVSSRHALSEDVKKKLCNLSVDYARGEGALFTDSSSDDESTDDGSESDVEHKWGELDKDADTTEEASRRLAVCNMDWDRIRAQDLLVLLSSFLPATGGAICSVTIYPSEFGLQRMKEEEVNGPPELREGKDGRADSEDELNGGDDEETEEGRKYHMEKLRQYQLNRLKYYYAVVECDGVATAEHLYKECDGLEYESSATRLDLRFVPDDMTFDQEPHDTCSSLPEPGQYSPQHFTTTALQQAKVDLTWDETDPRRVALAKKLQSADPNEVPDADLQAYLASDTSGDSDEEEGGGACPEAVKEEEKSDGEESNADPILRYRQLLLEAEQQEKERKKKAEGVEMEVTWGLGLKEKTEKLVKEKQKAASLEQATPFQQILEKRKEKRKLKREQRKKLQNGEQGSDDEDRPFSDDDVPSDVDMNDPFFREEMENLGVKGIGGANSSKKKGGGGKRKKRESGSEEEDEEEKQGKAELELLMLDEEPSDKRHFSLKKIQEAEDQSKKKKKRQKKKKKEEEQQAGDDDFQVNVDDDRFQALFTSHHYNIDPADPHYRKTKGTEALRQAKLSRRNQEDHENGSQPSSATDPSATTEERRKGIGRDAELSQLVKSVKRNTKNLKK